MRGLGTIVNVTTILFGSALGLIIGSRLPEPVREIALQGVGLVTIVLGVAEAGTSRNLAFPLAAIVIGGVIGELLRVEDRLEWAGERLRRLAEHRRAAPDTADAPDAADAADGASTFVEGFVTATLIFCVGPLTLLGSISDGLGNGAQVLFVKSVLDGTVSVVLASALGIGVALSALSVLVIQGLLTLGASALHQVLTGRMITETTATGGIMVLAIGLRLLEIKRIRVGSFLPALVLAPLAVAVFAR